MDRAELDRWLREHDYALITREQARIFNGPGVVPWDEHRRALAKVEAELDAARARVTELEAIKDRAERVITHVPDPDFVKAARFILDGRSGPYDAKVDR